MKVAVFPGSFDPVTIGHLDVIRRGTKIFDKVVVTVFENANKKHLFSASERVQLLKKATGSIKNVSVDCFSGLLVNYLKEKNIKFVLKGARNSEDFNYEFNMDIANKTLYNDFETIILPATVENVHICSRTVKEIALLGGDISAFVPECVRNDIIFKLNKGGVIFES